MVIHNNAVIINKIAHSVRIYGKYLSPRDMNGNVPDSFYKLIKDELTDDCYTAEFTNNGGEQYCLIVKKPFAIEKADNYIIIGKAELVCWEGVYYAVGETIPHISEFYVESNLVKCKERIGNTESEKIINIA